MSEAIARIEFERLRGWLFDAALPFWSTVGVDRDRGGFFERLSPDGAVLDDPRRARLVGRQIYAFATAGQLGWTGPSDDLVRHGLEQIDRRFFDPQGMVVSVIGPDGEVRNGAFDLYDHAFVLFGMAAAEASGAGSPGLAERAASLRDRMRAGWAHPHAGFEESRPRSLPLKANPHMHMLEASMAWLEIAPGLGWEALADEIAELCLARFLTPGEGALREYFDGDWHPLAGPAESVVEPGHQFEWAWLLIRWGQWRRRPDAIAAALRLIDIAEESGVDPVRGLAINELNADLTPRDGLARLWPQTERIKAFVALTTIAEDPDSRAAAWANAATAAAGLRRFLDHPVSGAWWEHIGVDGVPLVEPTRASSLYHLACAIAVMALGLQFE